MEQQSGSVGTHRKTYHYKLKPTPEQERALETVLTRCRMLYNCALEQRKTWWERGQGRSAAYYPQKAELPDLRAACPELAAVNAQVLQVVLQVECTYQAFFRRVANGEPAGYPRFEGWGATTPSPIPSSGAMAVPSWTTASWCSPRLDGWPCAGVAPS